jgi:hypothetical protein
LVVVAGILVLMVGHGVTSFLCQRVESLGIVILELQGGVGVVGVVR